MTIESKIEALTEAVHALTAALLQRTPQISAPSPTVALTAPVPATVAVSAVPSVTPTSPVQSSLPVSPATVPVMPAPPTFAAPVVPPAPAAPAVPFSDSKGLLDYVMAKYKALGPEKGAKIHNVLLTIGVQNINDVKPEQYAALFAGVEGIV